MEKVNNYEDVNCQKAHDYAIRDSEINDFSKCGYKIDSEKCYYNYLSNNEWDAFLGNINPQHKVQFKNAVGGELKKKKGRWGIYPPKMASYGSSSRFLYKLANDIPEFQFEKLLPTYVGHKANLDGYLAKDGCDIFIEAKCREIYVSHRKTEIASVYEDVFKVIKKNNNQFKYERVDKQNDNAHFYCTFKYGEEEIIHFDLKQLICHFLGITANILENKANKNVRFLYLIFNPDSDSHPTNFDNDNISRYKEQINGIYGKTLKEIGLFDNMKWLFDAVMHFQCKNLNKEKSINYKFSFKLVDQDHFKEVLQAF